MKAIHWLERADTVFDYLPFFSSVSNLTILFIKYAINPSPAKNNHCYRYLKEKPDARCITLLVPAIGNIVILIYDILKLRREKLALQSIREGTATLDDFQNLQYNQKFVEKVIEQQKDQLQYASWDIQNMFLEDEENILAYLPHASKSVQFNFVENFKEKENIFKTYLSYTGKRLINYLIECDYNHLIEQYLPLCNYEAVSDIFKSDRLIRTYLCHCSEEVQKTFLSKDNNEKYYQYVSEKLVASIYEETLKKKINDEPNIRIYLRELPGLFQRRFLRENGNIPKYLRFADEEMQFFYFNSTERIKDSLKHASEAVQERVLKSGKNAENYYIYAKKSIRKEFFESLIKKNLYKESKVRKNLKNYPEHFQKKFLAMDGNLRYLKWASPSIQTSYLSVNIKKFLQYVCTDHQLEFLEKAENHAKYLRFVSEKVQEELLDNPKNIPKYLPFAKVNVLEKFFSKEEHIKNYLKYTRISFQIDRVNSIKTLQSYLQYTCEHVQKLMILMIGPEKCLQYAATDVQKTFVFCFGMEKCLQHANRNVQKAILQDLWNSKQIDYMEYASVTIKGNFIIDKNLRPEEAEEEEWDYELATLVESYSLEELKNFFVSEERMRYLWCAKKEFYKIFFNTKEKCIRYLKYASSPSDLIKTEKGKKRYLKYVHRNIQEDFLIEEEDILNFLKHASRDVQKELLQDEWEENLKDYTPYASKDVQANFKIDKFAALESLKESLSLKKSKICKKLNVSTRISDRILLHSYRAGLLVVFL